MNNNEGMLEFSDDVNKKIKYRLDNVSIDSPDKDTTNDLNVEEITKSNMPYRKTFVIPIEHVIRNIDDDRSEKYEIRG